MAARGSGVAMLTKELKESSERAEAALWWEIFTGQKYMSLQLSRPYEA